LEKEKEYEELADESTTHPLGSQHVQPCPESWHVSPGIEQDPPQLKPSHVHIFWNEEEEPLDEEPPEDEPPDEDPPLDEPPDEEPPLDDPPLEEPPEDEPPDEEPPKEEFTDDENTVHPLGGQQVQLLA